MHRCVEGVSELPADLLLADRQVVDLACGDAPVVGAREVPHESHDMPEKSDDQQQDELTWRNGHGSDSRTCTSDTIRPSTRLTILSALSRTRLSCVTST